jgi:hypothetical protein
MLNTLAYKLVIDALCNDLNLWGWRRVTNKGKNKKKEEKYKNNKKI